MHTESADEFEQFRHAYNDEIKPRGIIAHQVVDELIGLGWEIRPNIYKLQKCSNSSVLTPIGPDAELFPCGDSCGGRRRSKLREISSTHLRNRIAVSDFLNFPKASAVARPTARLRRR